MVHYTTLLIKFSQKIVFQIIEIYSSIVSNFYIKIFNINYSKLYFMMIYMKQMIMKITLP